MINVNLIRMLVPMVMFLVMCVYGLIQNNTIKNLKGELLVKELTIKNGLMNIQSLNNSITYQNNVIEQNKVSYSTNVIEYDNKLKDIENRYKNNKQEVIKYVYKNNKTECENSLDIINNFTFK